jgi:hypothetical protein
MVGIARAIHKKHLPKIVRGLYDIRMPMNKCEICGNEFYIKPSHVLRGWGKCCSAACRSKSQLKGRFVSCHICGIQVWRMPKHLLHSKSGVYFCSKSCQSRWRNRLVLGENHYLWKGGRTTYRKLLLRESVPQMCLRCGLDDRRILVVHHVDENRSNNRLENLVWLCHNCHYLVHHDTDEPRKLLEKIK